MADSSLRTAPTPLTLAREQDGVSLAAALREFGASHDLLLTLLGREIRVRYKQAVLGILWALLQPLAVMALFTLVFNRLLSVPSDGLPYPLFSFVGLICWTFVANGLSLASTSLIGNVSLVTKVYFPRETLTVAAIGPAAIDFLFALGLLLLLLPLFHTPITATLLYLLPLFLATLSLILGVGLVLAALNVAYRDIRFVVPLALQLWMYASPVIYPASAIPARVRGIYYLNPVAGLIESCRKVVLHGQPPDAFPFLSAILVSAAALWLGYRYFKSAEWRFADVI